MEAELAHADRGPALSPVASAAASLSPATRVRLTTLIKRATEAGATEEQLEQAEDEADHRGALAALIEVLEARSSRRSGSAHAFLWTELSALKITALIKRATAAGVSQEAVERAEDSGNFKGTLVGLIVEHETVAAGDPSLRLRTELSSVRLTALIQRATSAGVSEASLDEAEDAADHRAALIELVVAAEMRATADGGKSEAARAATALRLELSGKKLRELIERASAVGVTGQQLDDAEDTDDHKEALIDLIVQAEPGARQPRSAHSPGPQPEPEPQPEPQPEPADDQTDSDASELIVELREMKPSLLSKRALSAGVDAALVDAALDADDSKQALIDLIVECESRHGPEERIASSLEGGGAGCATMVSDVLDHAMEVLEQLSVSSPRKSRKALLEAMERVEGVMDVVDEAWCDGLSRCGDAELVSLSGQLLAVRGLSSTSSSVSAVSDAVACLLDGLGRCGSTVLQSLAVMSSGGAGADGGGPGAAAVLGALEALRGLSEDRLEAVSADECAAFDAVMGHLSSSERRCAGLELESACVSLFKLGCRNGLVVCARAEVMEFAGSLSVEAFASLASSSAKEVLRAAGAACIVWHVSLESVFKLEASELRTAQDMLALTFVKAQTQTIRTSFTPERVRAVAAETMKVGLMEDPELPIACGCCFSMTYPGMSEPGGIKSVDDDGGFLAAMTLHRRVMPSPLPASWWVSTCDVIDATSVRLSALHAPLGCIRRMVAASSEMSQSASMWLPVAIDMAKINQEAGLTARNRGVNAPYLYQCLGLCEGAARHESQHSLLLESGVVDALEYTCLHDFPFFGGMSLSAVAAGGAVALLGRNEDGAGKTLSRDSVISVVDSVAVCFDKDTFQYERPLSYVVSNFARVATMCISDANKRHMLEHSGLVQLLLNCLVIDDDNPRRGQEGAEALQESCAGVFQELALFGPGASLLRSHGTLDALRTVARDGTPKSRERASAALFELEQEKRGQRLKKHGGGNAAGGVGTKKSLSPPHVMASYNWGHQEVILRVVSSLQDRGYLMWIDTEQMKGASVDTMALAVEGSEDVLIGVSRPYKESSNCRM